MTEGDPGAVTGAPDSSEQGSTAKPDDTGSRLLAAAAEVFAEKGYDRAGVAEIARRAGLTTGAIYSRFSGKAELLAAAIKASTPDEFDQLFAEHGFEGDAADILNTVGGHLVERNRNDDASTLLLEAFVAARRDPDVAAMLRSQFDDRRARLADLIDAGKDAGMIDTDVDTQAIVHFAHAVGLGFLLYGAIDVKHPDTASWEQVVARVVAAMNAPATPTAYPTANPTANPTSTPTTT